MVILFLFFQKSQKKNFKTMIFLSCFFEFLKKNSSIYKNSPKKKIGILTIVGQYFCFQIYEVGELGNHPQERTSPKFGRGK
jgi:hypothetical protein